jgi:ATP-dependent Clp protease ATP-binding subunit ClpA
VSAPTPTISPALNQCIQAAFTMARDLRHEFLTLEHLLLAMQDDPLVARAVTACGGEPERLRRDLEAYLRAHMEALPSDAAGNPTPTLGFNRVMERAILHTISSERSAVDSGAVLVSLLQERESQASYLLKRQGVNRLPLLKFLAHGDQEPAPAPQETAEPHEESEGQVRDPLSQTSPALESSTTARWLAAMARAIKESGDRPGMAKPRCAAICAVRARPDHANANPESRSMARENSENASRTLDAFRVATFARPRLYNASASVSLVIPRPSATG